MEFSFLIFTFLKALSENKVQDKVAGSKRLENELVVPGSFLTKTTSRATATNFEEEIIHLKNLCTHMDKIVEKLRRRPLFFKVTLPLVCEQFKGDETRLIRTLTLKLE